MYFRATTFSQICHRRTNHFHDLRPTLRSQVSKISLSLIREIQISVESEKLWNAEQPSSITISWSVEPVITRPSRLSRPVGPTRPEQLKSRPARPAATPSGTGGVQAIRTTRAPDPPNGLADRAAKAISARPR